MRKRWRKKEFRRIGYMACCTCIVFLLTGCSGTRYGLREYDDFDAFNAASAYDFYLPDGAEELRMAVDSELFSKAFFYSYVLEDKELEALFEKTIEEKYTKTNDDNTKEIVYDKYYGVQVKDIDDLDNYELDNFVHFLKYNSVIDDSVEEYYVLYYYPSNAGSYTEGILYNKETNRVLVYSYSTVK